MNTQKKLTVVKANQKSELYSENKLRQSLQKANLSPKEIQTIINQLNQKIYDQIPTSEIHNSVIKILDTINKPYSKSKYQLKQAIMKLGPTGFPFEKYVGALLKHYGYNTQVGIIVSGECVRHEIDVIAQNNNQHFMIECKHHHHRGVKSDVKVALYIKARFDDVAKTWKQKPGHGIKFHQAWLITNTKFTTDAITFGECVGIKMIGWNHPKKGSLQDLIESAGLHPITCLSSLSNQQTINLLNQEIILCKTLLDKNQSFLDSVNISKTQIEIIKKEIDFVCHN